MDSLILKVSEVTPMIEKRMRLFLPTSASDAVSAGVVVIRVSLEADSGIVAT